MASWDTNRGIPIDWYGNRVIDTYVGVFEEFKNFNSEVPSPNAAVIVNYVQQHDRQKGECGSLEQDPLKS